MIDLDKFKEEIVEDTKIDEMNLMEKQMMLPAIKHKWAARLIEKKRQLNSLNKKKDGLKERVLDSLKEKGMPPGIPKTALDKKIESSETILKIQEEIEDVKLHIEYLEKIETICRSMTYDLKNIIELTKLETT
jgi:hypothetical protein